MTSFFIDKTLRMCFYFDWQVVSILTYTEGFCSSVNLYPTTRLSRGFPDTKKTADCRSSFAVFSIFNRMNSLSFRYCGRVENNCFLRIHRRWFFRLSENSAPGGAQSFGAVHLPPFLKPVCFQTCGSKGKAFAVPPECARRKPSVCRDENTGEAHRGKSCAP